MKQRDWSACGVVTRITEGVAVIDYTAFHMSTIVYDD